MSDFSKEIDSLESIFSYPYGYNDFEFERTGQFDFAYQPTANENGQVLKKEVAVLRSESFLRSLKLFLLKRQGSELNRAYAAAIALVNKYGFTALIGFISEMEAIKKEVETFSQSEQKEETEPLKEEIFEPLAFDNTAQKLLLLESLGVLKALSETTGEEISSRKMGRIIADLLGTKDFTRHLRYFNPYSQPEDKNNPRTEKNLTALHRNLVKLKLPVIESIVEEQLKEVMKGQD